MTMLDVPAIAGHDLALAAPAILRDPVVYDGLDAEWPFGGSTEGLSEHLSLRGPRPSAHGSHGSDLVDALERAGLTGRGGAHVPSHLKWRAAVAAGPGGIVVVNGAEGEPASAKDAALLQLRPHLVLDGAALAAQAIQAREVVLWVHGACRSTLARIDEALCERRAAGVDDPPMRVVLAPDAYVAGESSSVISALQGGSPLPRFSRDRARPWGEGPAILVHNAETHARVALLARGVLPETSLLTFAETSSPLYVARRTVVEVPETQTLGETLRSLALPVPQAVLLGGYSGTWLAWEDAERLPVSASGLAAESLSLGAGVVLLLPQGRDGAREAAEITAYLAEQSAQQCGPCVFGLPELASSMREWARARAKRRGSRASRLASRRERRSQQRLDPLAELLRGRGACRHPDGVVRMALSAREVFGS